MPQGPIGGALPFVAGGNPFGKDPGASYASAYNAALDFNKANYSNIMTGFQQTMAAQQSEQAAIKKGYSTLEGAVMGQIAGTATAAKQDIYDTYLKERSKGQQTLINRGLGNTTIQQAVDRGYLVDRSKQEVNLANQFAQTTAQYQSQLGLAGLQYANVANQQQSQLAQQQLAWMNSVNAKYPNASEYMQMAMMQGANKAGTPGFAGFGGGGSVGGKSSLKGGPAGFAAPQFWGTGPASYGGTPWRPSAYGAAESVFPAAEAGGLANYGWGPGGLGDMGFQEGIQNTDYGFGGSEFGAGGTGGGYDWGEDNSWIAEQDAQIAGDGGGDYYDYYG